MRNSSYLDENTNLKQITGLQSLQRIKFIESKLKSIAEKIMIIKPLRPHFKELLYGYMRAINVLRRPYADDINRLIISYSKSSFPLIDLVDIVYTSVAK